MLSQLNEGNIYQTITGHQKNEFPTYVCEIYEVYHYKNHLKLCVTVFYNL